MPTYGLTATGFVVQPTPVIRDEISAAVRAQFGASLDLGDESFLGFLIGIIAERLGLLWLLAEAVNSSQDPDKATGAALDALAALTGTFRTDPRPSTVTLTLTGTPTTPVPAGSQARTASTGIVFETDANATIAALTTWAPTTSYVVGDRRSNSSRSYLCITAGTSAGSGGPSTTAADITDGTVHWAYLGAGTGAVEVAASAVETGPHLAVFGDITEIVTPVGGWQSVINVNDATPGANLGSDEELRLQRGVDLTAPGTSPADAIRQALLDVPNVTMATVFYNNTDVTNADNVPPHAVEALVQGGDDQDLWDALLANVAAGIATHGTESGTATDSQGNVLAFAFSRPDEIEIYVIVNVIVDAAVFPSDGADQIKAAIVAFGRTQAVGKNVVASSISAQAFTVDGVLDVGLPLIDDAPAPATSTTVVITNRQLAVFDTSRIIVNVSNGTP